MPRAEKSTKDRAQGIVKEAQQLAIEDSLVKAEGQVCDWRRWMRGNTIEDSPGMISGLAKEILEVSMDHKDIAAVAVLRYLLALDDRPNEEEMAFLYNYARSYLLIGLSGARTIQAIFNYIDELPDEKKDGIDKMFLLVGRPMVAALLRQVENNDLEAETKMLVDTSVAATLDFWNGLIR